MAETQRGKMNLSLLLDSSSCLAGRADGCRAKVSDTPKAKARPGALQIARGGPPDFLHGRLRTPLSDPRCVGRARSHNMLTGLMSDGKARPQRDARGAAGGAGGGEGAAERDLKREKGRDATENEECTQRMV